MSPSEGRRRRSSALSEIWKSTASSRLPVSPELRRRRFGIFSLKLMGVISIVFATIVAATTVTSSSRWTGSGASLRKFSSLHRLIIPEHHRLSSTPIAGIIRTTTGMVGLSSKCSRSSVNRHRGVASLSCGAKPGGGGGGGSGGAKRRRGGGANGDGDPNSKARNRRRSMGDSEAASRNRQPSSGGADRRRPMWDEEDEDGVSFGAAPGGNRERRRNRRKSVGGGGSNSQQSREARMAGLLDELFDDIERLQDSESRGASTNNVVDSNDKHNYDNDDDDHELEEEDLTKVNLSSDQLRAIGGINGQEWAESWEREKAALDDRGKEAVSVISAVAGTPEAVDRLREFSDVLSVPVLAAAFPFELDDYQLQSIRTILRNESLVLSAPTGAGKTVAGEAAVFAALAQNRRAFYTTPLKALSNQKFLDLSESLGAERVGLSTGDVRHNVDAEVVVMTTEVYRNMLYSRDNKNNPGAKSSSSTTANSAAAVEGEEAAVSSETEHSSSSPSSSVESSVASGVEPVEGGGEGGVVFEDQGRLESVFAVVLDE